MKLNRRHIRKLILREMSEMMPEANPVPPYIAQKAQEVGTGYIIDVSDMEGSGGGFYPGYIVDGGMARLDKEDVGTLAELLVSLSPPGGNIGETIFLYPSESEYARDFDQQIVNPRQNKPEDDNPAGGYFRPRA